VKSGISGAGAKPAMSMPVLKPFLSARTHEEEPQVAFKVPRLAFATYLQVCGRRNEGGKAGREKEKGVTK
jgi:hypothetical protein